MDAVRRKLHRQLDDLLDELLTGDDLAAFDRLEVEACLVPSQDGPSPQPAPRRIVLEALDISEWRREHGHDNVIGDAGQRRASHGPHSSVTSRITTAQVQPDNLTQTPPSSFARTEVDSATDGPRPGAVRRKMVGGLRPSNSETSSAVHSPPVASPRRQPQQTQTATRLLEVYDRQFPKRRKLDGDGPAKLEQSTVDKLIDGIWEQIHRSRSLAFGRDLIDLFESIAKRLNEGTLRVAKRIDFEDASKCCLQMTSGSRTGRALEVIVQAYWVDCYDDRIAALREQREDLKTCEVKKIVLTEACTLFHWSEKELRNRMAIWRGYREIKNSAGWVALIFAGPGIYRFCKYRLGFDQEAIAKLHSIKSRLEVAADTLQPQWRQLLSLVGAPTQLHWRGHPHDWVVSRRKDPIPLSVTCREWDPKFAFTNIEDSIIDKDKWGDNDPRRSCAGPDYMCDMCSGHQSLTAEVNKCECFPNLFGPNPRTPAPVQVFRHESSSNNQNQTNNNNNSLIACRAFPRGIAVGELVGLITCGLKASSVIQSHASSSTYSSSCHHHSSSSTAGSFSCCSSTNVIAPEPYQIWQGRQGNFARFINHSCQPNSQFQTFNWLGVQRIVIVSKGIVAGKEITVDYFESYWRGLSDRKCLCGDTKCKYAGSKRQRAGNVVTGETRGSGGSNSTGAK